MSLDRYKRSKRKVRAADKRMEGKPRGTSSKRGRIIFEVTRHEGGFMAMACTRVKPGQFRAVGTCGHSGMRKALASPTKAVRAALIDLAHRLRTR